MKTRLWIAFSLAALVAACGENPLQSTSGPSPLGEEFATFGDVSKPYSAGGRYSCSHEAPTFTLINTQGKTVTLKWTSIDGIDSYYVKVEQRRLEGDGYVPYGGVFVSETSGIEITNFTSGIYRATVQGHTDCDDLGDPSKYAEFSFGDRPNPPSITAPPIVVPPPGNGGNPPGNPPPGDGGNNPPVNPPGPPNPPPPPPGNGGDDDDHDGKECKNGGSGDHNQDLHPDCGLGNGNGHHD